MIQFDPYELGRSAYDDGLYRDAWAHFPGGFTCGDVEQFHRGWDEAEWEDYQQGLMPQRGNNAGSAKATKSRQPGC